MRPEERAYVAHRQRNPPLRLPREGLWILGGLKAGRSYQIIDRGRKSASRDGEVQRGTIPLTLDSSHGHFAWESWWNGYSLLVLLRRRPLLTVLRRR